MKITFFKLNLACFVLGVAVVWLSTHSWVAMLGTFIASLHFTMTKPEEVARG